MNDGAFSSWEENHGSNFLHINTPKFRHGPLNHSLHVSRPAYIRLYKHGLPAAFEDGPVRRHGVSSRPGGARISVQIGAYHGGPLAGVGESDSPAYARGRSGHDRNLASKSLHDCKRCAPIRMRRSNQGCLVVLNDMEFLLPWRVAELWIWSIREMISREAVYTALLLTLELLHCSLGFRWPASQSNRRHI